MSQSKKERKKTPKAIKEEPEYEDEPSTPKSKKNEVKFRVLYIKIPEKKLTWLIGT